MPTMADHSGCALNCGGRWLDLSHPHVMGVLNVTPDSFSDGGRFCSGGAIDLDAVLKQAEQMVEDGATLLDVGGESTRPGAAAVSLQEEMDRVLPVVEAISSRVDAVVSVDTSTPELMIESAAAGAGLLNDVRALTRPGALKAAAATGLPVCLMHMQGEPDTMQESPSYRNVVDEVNDYLLERADRCVQSGIARKQLVLDPGFGFGKRLQDNLMLLNRLEQVMALGYPVLVGMSRKTMLGQVTGRETHDRLASSLAVAVLAVRSGAQIVRVHDVRATRDAVLMCEAVMREDA